MNSVRRHHRVAVVTMQLALKACYRWQYAIVVQVVVVLCLLIPLLARPTCSCTMLGVFLNMQWHGLMRCCWAGWFVLILQYKVGSTYHKCSY